MSQTPIEVLGASVATLGEAVQGMEGGLAVLACAVAATGCLNGEPR